MKPLLAATIKSHADLALLAYPLIASPKLDGIRVLIHPELGPVTRKLKPIPNYTVREYLSAPEFHYMDGEIVVEGGFSNTTSAIMSQSGRVDFKYFVFDSFKDPSLPYLDRLATVKSSVASVSVLEYMEVNSAAQIIDLEIDYLARGFEGVMLRKPSGQYKFNRSTLNEQILLKLKTFVDDDATIIGFEELCQNGNKPVTNALGYKERASDKSGLIAMGTLGSLIVRSDSFNLAFRIGTGYDQQTRLDIWNRRDSFLGAMVKFKYQDIGIKDRPRFPVFLSFRED